MTEQALFTKFWTHETASQIDCEERMIIDGVETGVMKPPASPLAWSFLFDIVHHRGQISTYLRPMGAKVPSIYGPSGDEP
jgi:uncharacterized damage-inducible protein DinB